MSKLATIGVLAVALAIPASAVGKSIPRLQLSTAGSPSTVYGDAIGDAGDAPDVARVTIHPVAGGVAVDVGLAGPTRLGPYGWILFGVDTDANPYSGGGRGDELLLFANGEGSTFTRWTDGEFSPAFAHHDVQAALSATDFTFVLSWVDLGARSFNFSVATLRGENADVAPGAGIAAYPRTRTARPGAHTAHLHRGSTQRRRYGIATPQSTTGLFSGVTPVAWLTPSSVSTSSAFGTWLGQFDSGAARTHRPPTHVRSRPAPCAAASPSSSS